MYSPDNNKLANFDAVLFDMDGLLLDTETIALEEFEKAIARAGFVWADHIGLKLIGRNAVDGNQILIDHYGNNFDATVIRQDFTDRYQQRLQQQAVPLMRGAIELLQNLQQLALACALVTSSRRFLTDIKLQRAGILEYFTAIVCGDEISVGKPDPEGFLLAASKLNVDTKRCLVLEDSAAGIRAALSAGMTAWWIPDKIPAIKALINEGAVVFSDLAEAQHELIGINNNG